jgi:hypothetical protein
MGRPLLHNLTAQEQMSQYMSLSEAVPSLVAGGDTFAMQGLTHLIPSAAGHEMIRPGRRHLTVIRMTPDLLQDQLIRMGMVRKSFFPGAAIPLWARFVVSGMPSKTVGPVGSRSWRTAMPRWRTPTMRALRGGGPLSLGWNSALHSRREFSGHGSRIADGIAGDDVLFRVSVFRKLSQRNEMGTTTGDAAPAIDVKRMER